MRTGAAQSALTAEQLPLDANRIYRLSSDAGAPPQLVEFVFLATVPDTPDGLGALLAEKGCNAQLAMLSERLMVSGEQVQLRSANISRIMGFRCSPKLASTCQSPTVS